MSKQEEKKLCVTVGARLLYPKKKDGTFKCALELSKVTESKLMDMVKSEFPGEALKIKPAEDTGLGLLNVKSNYDIKVFDKEENEYDGPVYHGAQVYANILIKPYKYMGQKGITAYLGSMVLVENGEASGGGSYDSIMSKVI